MIMLVDLLKSYESRYFQKPVPLLNTRARMKRPAAEPIFVIVQKKKEI
jgi:hypothetical protein